VTPADSAGDDRHSDTGTTLRILDAVARGGDQSQRAMAGETGVALGLANAYLRRCARKGWIKMREAPARRYLYYITPQGFAEKARLTAEYLSLSFDLFRAARGQCDDIITACGNQALRKIALIGAGDLAEIAALSALGSEVKIVAVVDPKSNQSKLAGLPVVQSLDEIAPVDALVVTDITEPQAIYDALTKTWPDGRLFTPPMLRIAREDGKRLPRKGPS
jgi:DNA-binding MarR family transcriptional regulator